MPERTDAVWKTPALATVYLEGVRGAIPLARQQLEIMQRLIAACQVPVRRFLDLGSGDGVLASAVLERFPDAQAVPWIFRRPCWMPPAGASPAGTAPCDSWMPTMGWRPGHARSPA